MSKALKIWTLVIVLVLSLGVFGIFSIASDETTPTYEAELKTTVNGVTTTQTGTYNNMVKNVIVAVDTYTEYEITLYKDVAKATNMNFPNEVVSTANVKVSVFLNGHTLNHTGSLFNAFSNVSSANTTDIYLYVYGGKTADDTTMGTIYGTGAAGTIVYTNSQRTSPTSTVMLKNLNIIQTKCDESYSNPNNKYSDQPMFHFQTGTVNMENVHMTYTGEDAISWDPANKPISDMMTEMIRVNTKTSLYMKDCTITDTNTKNIQTRGIQGNTTGVISLENVKINGQYFGIYTNAASLLTLRNCEIATRNVPLNVGSTTSIYDTVITTPDGIDTILGGGSVTFYYGEGKTIVNTTDGRALIGGAYTVEDGYSIGTKGDGKFFIDGASNFTTVALPTIFASGMVFQRNEPIKIYGYCATEGATVKIIFDGEEKSATVVNGAFSATFSAREAEKDLTFSVQELGVKYPTIYTYDNVDIGEVWVASGQSNIQYEAYKMQDFEEYLMNADNYGDNIRFFTNPTSWHVNVQTLGAGKWVVPNSETLTSKGGGDFSAIAYVMATRLAVELPDNITIAVIDATYGGSSIQSWTEESIYREMVSNNDTFVTRLDAYRDFYNENGRYPESKKECDQYFADSNGKTDGYRNILSSCYNVMVAQLTGYKVRGIVWLQGENAIQKSGAEYYRQYEALTTSYRTLFDNDNLPFYVIQIHPFDDNVSIGRTIQYQMVLNDKNSHIIAATLEGNAFNTYDMSVSNLANSLIHPCVKSPVGQRVAESILYYEYGIGDGYLMKAPEVMSITASGSTVTVTFDTELYTFYGEDVVGFEIAGADGVFYTATATISGNTVTLTSDFVTAPTKVRYGCINTHFELKDGTVFEFLKSMNSSAGDSATCITVIAPDGTSYQFHMNSDDVIRTFVPGSLTNASGHPTPVFVLDVGYEAE